MLWEIIQLFRGLGAQELSSDGQCLQLGCFMLHFDLEQRLLNFPMLWGFTSGSFWVIMVKKIMCFSLIWCPLASNVSNIYSQVSGVSFHYLTCLDWLKVGLLHQVKCHSFSFPIWKILGLVDELFEPVFHPCKHMHFLPILSDDSKGTSKSTNKT